jgi:hypothetical protein
VFIGVRDIPAIVRIGLHTREVAGSKPAAPIQLAFLRSDSPLASTFLAA